jgi:hypothetical protein
MNVSQLDTHLEFSGKVAIQEILKLILDWGEAKIVHWAYSDRPLF